MGIWILLNFKFYPNNYFVFQKTAPKLFYVPPSSFKRVSKYYAAVMQRQHEINQSQFLFSQLKNKIKLIKRNNSNKADVEE